MKSVVLGLAAVLAFSASAFATTTKTLPTRPAHGGVSPLLFAGNYRLTSNSLGMCSPEILVAPFQDNDGAWGIEAGNYTFMRINVGPWTDDDAGVRVSQSTYTTADQRLIKHSHTIDHAEPDASFDQTVEFHLVGKRLNVKSFSHHVMPGGGWPMDYPVQCSYVRIRCEDSAAGCI